MNPMFGIIEIFGSLIGGVVGLLYFVFWLWMLINAITNKGLSTNEKILWVLLIIFLPCIGSIIYFFIAKPKAG